MPQPRRERLPRAGCEHVEGQRLERPDGAKDALLEEKLEAAARVAQNLQRGVLTAHHEALATFTTDAHQRLAHRGAHHCLGEEHRRRVERVPGISLKLGRAGSQ
jgi:hypothetical protein